MTRLRKAERTFATVWVLWILLVIAFWIGVIYIALHFISKHW